MSTTLVPPKPVSSRTRPSGCSLTSPMTTLSRPMGWARMAPSRVVGMFTVDDNHHSPFAGHVKRVDAEHLAHPEDL